MTETAPDNRTAEATPRLPNGRFPRGVSGNPGGLPKGLAEVKELARKHTALAITTLAELAEKGESEMARIAASNSLLDRGWGKCTQPVSGDADMPPFSLTPEDRELEIAREIAAARESLAESFREVVRNDEEEAGGKA